MLPKTGLLATKSSQRMIEAAERFQAIENVPKNGSFGDKILPSNESQVRPLTQLSDAEAVHVWGQVTEQHERLYKSMT